MTTVKKLSDTVCIVGLAPATRDMVLEEPDGVEIWTLNQAHAFLPPDLMARVTRHFQVHPYEEMVARQRPETRHLEWMEQNRTIPVYMEETQPNIPMSVRYPKEKIQADLGALYLTSAIAFMLALAMHERFSLIKLFGVELSSQTEYEDQRPCLEYLLGRAIERGIKVWLPPECPLLKGPLYARTVMIASSHVQRRMMEMINAANHARDACRETQGQVKFCQVLLEGPYSGPGQPLHGAAAQFLKERLAVLVTTERARLGEYNSIVGSVLICEELLAFALRGNKGAGATLVQNEDGMVQLPGGTGGLYARPDVMGEPSSVDRFWPENLPPTDISERAQLLVDRHNEAVLSRR